MRINILFILAFIFINFTLLYIHLFLFRTTIPKLFYVSLTTHIIALVIFPYKFLFKKYED